MRRLPFLRVLLTKAEFFDEGAISLNIRLLEVSEKVSSVTYHFEKSAVGVIVMRVLLDVLVQVVDAGSQNSDLDLRRTGVALVGGILSHDGLLFFFGHFVSPHSKCWQLTQGAVGERLRSPRNKP